MSYATGKFQFMDTVGSDTDVDISSEVEARDLAKVKGKLKPQRRSRKERQKRQIKILEAFRDTLLSPDFTRYVFVKGTNYNYKTWRECFPNGQVELRKLLFNAGWYEFLYERLSLPYFKKLEESIGNCLENTNAMIVPPAELVLNAFNLTSPSRIRVVILGQDPYPGGRAIDVEDERIWVPNAMGSCFSVPIDMPISDSEVNIFKNMISFGHLQEMPEGGCLSFWALQGCFLFNAALTTINGKCGAHRSIWQEFTSDVIHYLATNFEKLVFVLWGVDANNLCKDVDPNRHCIISSSHPSPQSCHNTFRGYKYGDKSVRRNKDQTYPSFMSVDHFGKINQHLVSIGQQPIYWNLVF